MVNSLPRTMGAGASSVAALRPIRAERCSTASSSFDGLALLADGKPCGCKICAKREGRAAPLIMDKDDAYTLTTAMRVIDRSQAKVMPPRAAPPPQTVTTTPGAEPGAAAAASSPVFDDSPAKPAIEAYSRKIVSDGAQILQRRALGEQEQISTADHHASTTTVSHPQRAQPPPGRGSLTKKSFPSPSTG